MRALFVVAFGSCGFFVALVVALAIVAVISGARESVVACGSSFVI
jgi:hypothetical protein